MSEPGQSELGQNSAEQVCRQIYEETKSFYRRMSEGRTDDCGFQILYGPPYFQPPILLVGYQPGRGTKTALEERAYGSEDGWPSRIEYATEPWPLARRLREMFGKELVEKCVGLNAIFFRANSVEDYKRQWGSELRAEIEAFCRQRIETMVKAIQPKPIVAIGFATLDLFGGGVEGKTSAKGRVLTKVGKIAGQDAVGVLHLTGAYISTLDRKTIADHIRERWPACFGA